MDIISYNAMGEWAHTSPRDAGQLTLSQTGGRLCPGTTLLLAPPPWIFRHAEILESYVFYKLATFKYF